MTQEVSEDTINMAGGNVPVERRAETGCAIVGACPAGLMLGLLLARAGVDVTVLEKHADFWARHRVTRSSAAEVIPKPPASRRQSRPR